MARPHQRKPIKTRNNKTVLNIFLLMRDLLPSYSLYASRPVLFPEVGMSKHLFRAFHGELADISTHDVRDLTDSLFGAQFIDNGDGSFVEYLLIHIVVGVGKRGDLW